MASFPTFPSFDLSSFDLSKIDLSKFDLSKFDLSKFEVAGIDTDKVLGVLRDAAYVAIGFGVLTVQQAQVRRRELSKQLDRQRSQFDQQLSQLGLSKEQVDDVVKQLEARFGQLDQRLDTLESKLDTAIESVLDTVGERLPEQAGALLGQAHEVAKAARKQMRGLLVSAA